MKTSHLAFTFILTVLLVGSLSAQPMDQSTTLITSDKQVTEKIPSTHLLYDNLCSSPIDMTGSPTETRYITAGTCVQISPNLSCPECGDNECECTVTITGPRNFYLQIWWDCYDGQPIYQTTSLCFSVDESGDYTFTVDVCSGENGVIQCGTCCN
jgi:hypothetical protein